MARRGYATPPGYEGVKPGKGAKPKMKPPVRKPVVGQPTDITGSSQTTSFQNIGVRPGESSTPMALPPLRGTTISTTPVVSPPPSASATAPPPPGSSWWASQYTSDPRYLAQAPQLSQEYANIGEQYGLVINRVTDRNSPYYGRVVFRTGADAPGAGSIVQDFDATTGRPIYRNIVSGEVVTIDPQTLMLDVRQLGRGEAGYKSGKIGGATLESEGRQVKIGEQAAAAGARKSGMRAVASTAEVGALQRSLADFARASGQSVADVNRRYMELYNQIYADLSKNPPAPPGATSVTSVTGGAGAGAPSGELPPLGAPTTGVGERNVPVVPEVPTTTAGGYVAGAQVSEVTIDKNTIVFPAGREARVRQAVSERQPVGGWRVGNIVDSYQGSGKNKGYEVRVVVVGVNPLRLRVERVKSSPPRTGTSAGAWT